MFESRYQHITFSRRDRVLTATFNRPDKLNAVSGDMHRELSDLFHDLAADPDSDVIVLTGAGKAFSAGGDLDFLERCQAEPAVFQESLREGRKLIMGMLECDKPIVCRLNGDAVGLGATVALFCDIIIAADTAKIGDPHVRIGLVAGDGGALIWPQLIGYARAKQYLLTGDLITAPEAAAMGLINFAVPAAELDALVDRWAGRLAKGPRMATRWTKATINTGLKQLAGTLLDTGLAYEGQSARTDDHREATAALRQRRAPVFTGR